MRISINVCTLSFLVLGLIITVALAIFTGDYPQKLSSAGAGLGVLAMAIGVTICGKVE